RILTAVVSCKMGHPIFVVELPQILYLTTAFTSREQEALSDERRQGMRRCTLALVGTLLVASCFEVASARAETIRTCAVTIKADIGKVRVLRKLGPKQVCPEGEAYFEWSNWAFRGDWQPDVKYSKGDVVAFDGSSYVSVEDANQTNE